MRLHVLFGFVRVADHKEAVNDFDAGLLGGLDCGFDLFERVALL